MKFNLGVEILESKQLMAGGVTTTLAGGVLAIMGTNQDDNVRVSNPTATTVQVRDGEVLLTDGPFAEGAEVANGFYLLSAADRDEAAEIASMIPATAVQLRRLAGIAGL